MVSYENSGNENVRTEWELCDMIHNKSVYGNIKLD